MTAVPPRTFGEGSATRSNIVSPGALATAYGNGSALESIGCHYRCRTAAVLATAMRRTRRLCGGLTATVTKICCSRQTDARRERGRQAAYIYIYI